MKIFLQNIVNKLVLEEIQSLSESFRGFSLKQFKKLKTSEKMIKYAKEHLPYLGKGISRTVFGLGAGKVLKIQHSGEKAFLKQNRDEVKAYTDPKIPKEYLAKIFDYDKENYYWIVSEGAQVIKDNYHLRKKINVDNDVLSDFFDNIAIHKLKFEDAIKKALEHYNEYLRPPGDKKINVKDLTDLDIQLFKGINELIKKGVDDIDRLDHWGITTNGRLVLVDYGIGDYGN